MSRFVFALIASSLASASAEAASLIHPSAAAKTVENGVAVWRGEAPEKIAPPALKPAAPCARVRVAVRFAGYPARALRTHGFWSGDDRAAAYQATTQGFYADRIAAGL